MNKRLNYLLITCACLNLCSACDEGKIYPDDTIDSGRTATVTLHFTHLDAWPQKNNMSLISLGEDGVTPILVKRILEPSSEAEAVTVTLNNLNGNTRSIAVAVITSGMSLVHAKCVMCHGGSTTTAGDLDLTAAKAYQSLINVKAPHSAKGKNYVTPGDLNNSYLLDVLEHDNHIDIFNGAEQREVRALIRTWIKAGAENN